MDIIAPRTDKLFPLPLEPGDQPGTTPFAAHGWCRPWCCISDASQRDGMPVDEHGPHCSSLLLGGRAKALDEQAEEHGMYLSLVEQYSHGVYPSPPVDWPRAQRLGPLLRLLVDELDEDQERPLFFEPSTARSLAAALLRLADVAEKLERVRA